MHQFLDTRQLAAFDALIETGSFTEAAKRLNLTQSAVSHSIRNLEDELNCQLVHRARRCLLVTADGQIFHEHARRILGEMDEVRNRLKERSDWGKGRLRIGASTTACEHFLPDILREFNECFPDCALSIKPVDTPQLVEEIRTGDLDLAIIIQPEDIRELEIIPLFKDELKLVTSAIHPWAKTGKVSFEQMPEQRLILYNKRSQTHRIITEFFKTKQIELLNSIELASMEAIIALVKTNFGISILADWIVESAVNSKSLTQISMGRNKVHREWAIAHIRGKKLSITEETFLGIAQSFAEARFGS